MVLRIAEGEASGEIHVDATCMDGAAHMVAMEVPRKQQPNAPSLLIIYVMDDHGGLRRRSGARAMRVALPGMERRPWRPPPGCCVLTLTRSRFHIPNSALSSGLCVALDWGAVPGPTGHPPPLA